MFRSEQMVEEIHWWNKNSSNQPNWKPYSPKILSFEERVEQQGLGNCTKVGKLLYESVQKSDNR